MDRRTICYIDGCDNAANGYRGLCQPHYRKLTLYGDPLFDAASRKAKARTYLDSLLKMTKRDECIIWPFRRNAMGYGTIKHMSKSCVASRVICEAVHGSPPSEKAEAAHSCGNGAGGCVNPRHLSWKTRSENQADRATHGTSNRGERSARGKLKEADVREIRRQAGKVSDVALSRKFSVSTNAIWEIKTGKSWGWLV